MAMQSLMFTSSPNLRCYAPKQAYCNIGTSKNNQSFVVVCLYISQSFNYSSIVEEFELLLNDISNLMGSTGFIVGDMNFDLLKKGYLSSIYSSFVQFNAMTQLIETANDSP